MSRTCYLLWTNKKLNASEATAIGLVDELLPAPEFQTRVATVAAGLAAAPQLAIRLARAALRTASVGSLSDALDAEALAQSLCLQSADHRESVRAFLSRRGVDPGR